MEMPIAMNIIIKTKHLELTEALENYIHKKISGLTRFIDVLKSDDTGKGKTLAEISFEMSRQTRHHRKGDVYAVEAIIFLPGRKKLVAKASGEDIRQLIVRAKDDLEQEIKKYKTQRTEAPRREQRKLKKEIIK